MPAINSYYVTGWTIAGLTLVLIPSNFFDLKKLTLFTAFYILSWIISGYVDWNTLPISIIFCLFFSLNLNAFIRKEILAFVVELTFVILSLYFTYKFIFQLIDDSNFNHSDTYSAIGIGVSRNMLFEYYSAILIIYTYNSCSNRKILIYHSIGLVLSVLFLSKCALLVIMLSLIYYIWKNRFLSLNRSLIYAVLAPLLLVFLVFNSYNLHHYNSNKSKYREIVENRSSHLKEIDIIYQFINPASSINQRLEIWRKSKHLLTFKGIGIGNWKIKYNCYNEPKNGVITRRAHNEFIRYIAELGILSLFPLFLFVYNIKFLFPVIPLFLFSYPTERAEFLVILLLLPSSWYFSRLKTEKIQAYFITFLKVSCAFFICLWAYINYLQYDLLIRNSKYSKLNNFEKKIVRHSKRDFFLNRIEIFKIKDPYYPVFKKNMLIKKILDSNNCELKVMANKNKHQLKGVFDSLK